VKGGANGYRGLTWNHPRGYRALDESVRSWSEKGLHLSWERQSLEEFESRSISEVCSKYDLVVLDHPHLGEAMEARCLIPLEDWCEAVELTRLRQDTIGRVLDSYFYEEKHWALPLDAATQVLACRTDLLPSGYSIQEWEGICRLSEVAPVIVSLAGPHALLTFFSICIALGEPPLTNKSRCLITPETGEKALQVMSMLVDKMEASGAGLNPIQILETMATSDRIACCPLVYGYVNYSVASDAARRAISFKNAPRFMAGSVPGSILGGTGIGVSFRTAMTPELKSYLLWLVSSETQRGFLPRWDGQPCLRSAWLDSEVNRQWNSFYIDTAETVEHAWVRPRFPGYIKFQTEASALLRTGLLAQGPASTLLQQLSTVFETYRSNRF
jgi:multiple sugar transport system substrate-binding protein